MGISSVRSGNRKRTTNHRKLVRRKTAGAGTQRHTRAGDATRQRILQAAQRLLAEVGHNQLTMKQIADACKISVGNVTYHYPTRELIIQAMVNHLLNDYMINFSRLLSSKQLQTEVGVEIFMKWLLTDATDYNNARLFRELWMLSSHYPEVRKRMVNFYNKLIRSLVQLLAQKNPNIEQSKLQTVGCLLAVLAEGTGIVYGGRYRLPVKSKELIPDVVKMVTEYIQT